jgi:hypothetical protein
MSAECERLFSAAGRMVTPLRRRLDVQVIGTCQVLRLWLRAGIIRGLDLFFVSAAEEQDNLKMAHMIELQEWAIQRGLRMWLSATKKKVVGNNFTITNGGT